MAPPPPTEFVELAVFKVKVLAPFKVVVPEPVVKMAPPALPAPLVALLLVKKDAPFSVALPPFHKAPPFVVEPLLVKVEPPDSVNVEEVSL